MTLDELIQKKKENRTNLLNQKVDLEKASLVAIEEDDFNDKYLWGDGTYIGVQDLIKLYYTELNKSVGRDFTHPSFSNYTQTYWNETIFVNALSDAGDETNGFYPDGSSSQEINESSSFLTDNGDDGEDSLGLIEDGTSIETAISNLETRRTEDLEEPAGPDTPNYYLDPEKSALIGAISTYITNLEDLITTLEEIETEVSDISNNDLFTDAGMNEDVIDTTISAYLSFLEGHLGDNLDVVTDGTIYGYYNFFNTANGEETDFNDYLTELETLIGTTIFDEIIDRATNVRAYVGETSSQNLNKWRTFWIKARIAKPEASLITVNGISDILDSIDTIKLPKANNELNELLGTNLEYIPTLKMYASYEDNLFNDNGSLNTRRISLVYQGINHATRYDVFRQNLSTISINNNDWSEDYLYDTVTDLNDLQNIKSMYTDTDENFLAGQKFIYRIRAYDNENDSITSQSLQSKIYDDTTSYSFSVIENSLIDLGEEHGIKPGFYVVLSEISENDGFYLVLNSNETKLSVYPAIESETSGVLYVAKGVVFILQSQPVGPPLSPPSDDDDEGGGGSFPEGDYSYVPHNNLGNIQGGNIDERYHLSLSLYDKLNSISESGEKIEINVNASSAIVADQLSINDVVGCQYFIMVENSSDTSILSSEKIDVIINGITSEHTEYGMIDINGGNNYSISLSTSGNYININFTNNESDLVKVFLYKQEVTRNG
jgi:hypothetical protein